MANNSEIYLSVVIPAYNEEKRIAKTIKDICNYLNAQDYSWELIVVDDGSKDKTIDVSKAARGDNPLRVLENEVNRGKGYTVIRGCLAAKGKYVLFTDADQSTPIQEVEKLLKALEEEGYDLAIGSRGLDRSTIKKHQPWMRETMGRVFNLIVQALVVRGFKDTQCGFKCFRREAAQEVLPRQVIRGFSFDVEAIFIAVKLDYKVKEIPVDWYDDPSSTVHPIKHSIQMFRDVVNIRRNNKKGVYDQKNVKDEG